MGFVDVPPAGSPTPRMEGSVPTLSRFNSGSQSPSSQGVGWWDRVVRLVQLNTSTYHGVGIPSANEKDKDSERFGDLPRVTQVLLGVIHT